MIHTSHALPSRRRSAEEQARFHQAITELWEQRITFNTVLGLKIESLDPATPRLRFEMRPELVGHFLYGRLHGGVISAALDAMGGFALTTAIGEKHPDESTDQVLHRFGRMGTIDLRIDYLRQGIGKHFIATAEVTRLGGRVGSTQMRLHNDEGVLIATGAAAYIVS
ncbi:thioesterase family protein [Sphaerotilus sp.]|uniref:thioesterase family protein n=1 Tax=Sphaerotilus sp. TaxID=2093942 RepID=UPI00286D99DC|nr:thioesterase family protein [Sphaerotilus sp.]